MMKSILIRKLEADAVMLEKILAAELEAPIYFDQRVAEFDGWTIERSVEPTLRWTRAVLTELRTGQLFGHRPSYAEVDVAELMAAADQRHPDGDHSGDA